MKILELLESKLTAIGRTKLLELQGQLVDAGFKNPMPANNGIALDCEGINDVKWTVSTIKFIISGQGETKPIYSFVSRTITRWEVQARPQGSEYYVSEVATPANYLSRGEMLSNTSLHKAFEFIANIGKPAHASKDNGFRFGSPWSFSDK